MNDRFVTANGREWARGVGGLGVTKEDSRFRRVMTRGKAGVRGEFVSALLLGIALSVP
jgi:hypothetical protein